MDFMKKKHWPYILTALWIFSLVTLGGWWLYLVFQFGSLIEASSIVAPIRGEKLYSMIKWEGLTFIILLISLSLSLVYLNLRDSRNNQSIAAFFASLTHELKTPLASIRLQSEFLQDLVDQQNWNPDQAKKLTARLIDDVNNLESSLDKSLQLARLEKNAPISLHPVNIKKILESLKKQYQSKIHIDLQGPKDSIVLAEELAVILIFKNLIENTLRHQPQQKKVNIHWLPQDEKTVITYNDKGSAFEGEQKKLGKLFYKFKSSKGTGLGLYIIKELMHKLKGKLTIKAQPHLVFHLTFKRHKE